MNYVQVFFSLVTLSIIVLGSLINKFESKLPIFIRQIFRYGKFSYSGKGSKLAIEVPKSSFKQFYQAAVVFFTYILYLVVATYVFNAEIPVWFAWILNLTCGKDRIAHSSKTRIVIAISLLWLQVVRRFYDTHFISIFSKSRINISHYIIGMTYYPMVALAVLCEAPDFATFTPTKLDQSSLIAIDYIAIVVFLWSWWHQHVNTVILADLRKDKSGKIVNEGYKLPQGDWFAYLSCPHQTAEILMYLALTILLWHNITWRFVTLWVLSNQVETILLSHWWYQDTFKQFPKTRKALIPLIY